MEKKFEYHLGLDLGTSNTACSYLNQNGELVKFEYAGHAQTPSILSCEEGEICIGSQARNRIGYGIQEGIYRSYKMHVDIKDQSELERLGYTKDMGPGKVLEEYIINYLDEFRTEMDIKQVDSITIGAPEIFFRSVEGTDMRTELKKIVERTGYAKYVRVVSEPAAASAYYLYTNEKQNLKDEINNSNRECYLLTIDAGGGTLDITITHHSVVDGKRKIYTVARSGAGENHDHSRSYGKSGVYYIEEVIRAAIQQIEPENTEIEEDAEFRRVFCELEDYLKNMKSKKHEEMVGCFKAKQMSRNRRRREENNTVGWTLRYKEKKLPITYDLMYDVYEKTFHRILERELEKIKQDQDVKRCQIPFERKDDGEEQDSIFRVIMVGGFSAFPLVRYQIEKYFGKLDVDDPRFGAIGVKEASQAVANGLALLGGGAVEYSLRAPYGLAVVGYLYDEYNKRKECGCLGVNYGDFLNPLEDMENPFMAHSGVYTTKEERKNHAVSFWDYPQLMGYNNGSSKKFSKMEVKQNIKEEMKQALAKHTPVNGNRIRCKIGFSFDESCMLYIHFISEHGEWSEKIGPKKLEDIFISDEGAAMDQTVELI